MRISSTSQEEAINGAKTLTEGWTSLTPEQKRQMVEATTDRITVGKDEIEIQLVALPLRTDRQSATEPHGCVALWRMPAPVRLRAETPEPTAESTSALASALRRRRAELEFSRASAAMRMSVSERTVRAWETGRTPDVEHWPRIIDFLGFEPWPEPMTPVQNLQAARRRQGLTISQTAQRLGVDASTLWWWEHGRKPHRREHKERIAAFVGVSAAEALPDAKADSETKPAAIDPISSLIRSRRRELSLSQEQAAAAIGVNTWTVLLWEQGRYAPAPRVYPSFIRFLGREPWPEPRTIGERLQAERLRRGLTRKQLAGVLGVDLGSISNWEGGGKPHHRLSIAKIEALLGGDPQPRRKSRRR